MTKYKLSKYNITYLINDDFIGIFNSLTKSLSIFKSIFNIENGKYYLKELNTLNKSIFFSLKNNNFIINDEINEEVLMKQNYFLKNSKGYPTILINLTYECNFNCSYCFEKHEDYINKNMETVDENCIIFFISKFISEKKNKFYLHFFGGEPLLEKEKLFRIINKVKKLCDERKVKLFIEIVTNGYLMDKEFIENILKYNCRMIQVTLDGLREVHDKRRILKDGCPTFDVIIKNIEYAVNVLPRNTISIRVNIDKSNLEQYKELYKYLKNKNLTEKIHYNPGIIWTLGNEEIYDCKGERIICLSDYEAFFEENVFHKEFDLKSTKIQDILSLDYIPCLASTNNYYSIDPNGDLKKCYVDTGEDRKIGNIKEEISLFNDIYIKYLLFEPWNCNAPH